MKEIPLTKGYNALVDDENYAALSSYKWFAQLDKSGKPYAARWTPYQNGRRRELRMHREILSPPEGFVVDHINRDTLDNRRLNLRVCTQAENLKNKGMYRCNSTGIKGVYWDKGNNKWRASKRVDGRLHYLGIYTSKETAAEAIRRFCGN